MPQGTSGAELTCISNLFAEQLTMSNVLIINAHGLSSFLEGKPNAYLIDKVVTILEQEGHSVSVSTMQGRSIR